MNGPPFVKCVRGAHVQDVGKFQIGRNASFIPCADFEISVQGKITALTPQHSDGGAGRRLPQETQIQGHVIVVPFD